MAISVKTYLESSKATLEAQVLLREFLIALGVPAEEIQAEEAQGGILQGKWGQALIRQYIAAREMEEDPVSPLDTVFVNAPPSLSGCSPVLSSAMVARELSGLLISLKSEHSFAVGPSLTGLSVDTFEESVRNYCATVDRELWTRGNRTSIATFLGSQAPRLPSAPNFRDAPSGSFGHLYANVPSALVTSLTQDQVFLEQLLEAVRELKPEDIDETLIRELYRTFLKLTTVVSELKAFALERGALASLQVERVQTALFDMERSGVRVGRLHINMTAANKLDSSNNLGNIFLQAVLEWFADKFPEGHVIRSPERTTFQFLPFAGGDTAVYFKNFAFDVRRRMGIINDSITDEKEKVDPRVITEFDPRAVVASLSISRKNIIRYAIRKPEDIDAFRDVLVAMGHDPAVLDTIKQVMRGGEGRARVLQYLGMEEDGNGGRGFDVDAILARDDPNLNRALQALMLKAIYWFSRELAGATTFFEKERGGPADPVAVFTEADAPSEQSEDYELWQRYVRAGQGFVSQGVYDPLQEVPELAQSDFISGLPHMRFLLAGHRRYEDAGEVDRLLRIFSRLSHRVGVLSHPARMAVNENFFERISQAFEKLVSAEDWKHRGPALCEFGNALHLVNWKEIPSVYCRRFVEAKRAAIKANDDESRCRARAMINEAMRRLRKWADPGGALERVEASIKRLNQETSNRAAVLEELKTALADFVRVAQHTYALAVADPKYALAFKSARQFATGRRTINVDLFKQELARTGWRNIAVIECDSFKALSAAMAGFIEEDYNDSLFQRVRDTIFLVALRWNMDIPLLVPTGGDLFTVAFPDADRDGLPVDSGAFIAEVQRLVSELYKHEPYPDTRKVVMEEAHLDVERTLSGEEIVRATRAVAERFDMQTIPSITIDRQGAHVLSVPKHDGFNPYVGVEDVVRMLSEEGIPIKSFSVLQGDTTVRLPIWVSRRQGKAGYRFGLPRPRDADAFMKTFSVTAAVGRLSAGGAGDYAREALLLCDRVEGLKEAFFPGKGGLGFGRSACFLDGRLGDEIGLQIDAFTTHAGWIDRQILTPLDRMVATLSSAVAAANAAGFCWLVRTQMEAMQSFSRLLRIKSYQMLAFNNSFGRRLEESYNGAGFSEVAKGGVQVARRLISQRSAAAAHLASMTDRLDVIFGRDGGIIDAHQLSEDARNIRESISEFRRLADFKGEGSEGNPAAEPDSPGGGADGSPEDPGAELAGLDAPIATAETTSVFVGHPVV